MSSKPATAAPKVHVSIGHERSLCGLSPYRGDHDIRTIATFFLSSEKDQCAKCLHRMTQRGYRIQTYRDLANVSMRLAA